ncbi:MAG: type II toxin-antitoxin system RelE/ParE family toxin [Verrucomicrobiota bacterium]
MNRTVRKSECFMVDFSLQYHWDFPETGENLALGYLNVVDSTLEKLSRLPDLGRPRHFPQPELRGIRSFTVENPFDSHLIFYRFDEQHVDAWRIMHGARHLPNRLIEPAK